MNFEHINHLKQEFNIDHPNEVWVSDMTYIKTQHGFVYLCVIIDLFSRRVIAWKLSSKIDTALVLECTEKAIETRRPRHPVIFHSDRGTQYTAFTFRKFLDKHNVIQSFSKLAMLGITLSRNPSLNI